MKPDRDRRCAWKTRRIHVGILVVLMAGVCASSLAATAVPSWWFARGVIDTNLTANDFAAVVQGQVKNMASNAAAEMDADLPPIGAGSNITALINSFSPTNNYLGVTLGQLKYVAQPFYDRLRVIGYTNAYPWTSSPTTNDYAAANIGQLKNLFAWDLTNFRVSSLIAAGRNHSLAARTDGVWAWGYNGCGQLGDGTTVIREIVPELIAGPACDLTSISNVIAIAGGGDYSVAVDGNGIVWTWGCDDGAGELGQGAITSTNSPAPITTGLSNVVGVAAGNQHTLALCTNGTVFAWGQDASGQLGVGWLPYPSLTNVPIQTFVLTQIVAIAAGDSHSLALDSSGHVFAWGNGNLGQNGDPSYSNVATPTMLTTISNVIAIAAGFQHSIAITADNTVWTWGDNVNGALGRSDTNNGSDWLPEPVPGLSNVVAIAGGDEFTLAVTSNGQVYAWGKNSDGQLGTNTATVSITNPVLVAGITNAVSVAAHPDGYHSLAVTVNQGTNLYYGWGKNDNGQVGNGSASGLDQYTPARLGFCEACSSCVPMGTGGVFMAQCSGTLKLYFNDQITAFNDNTGSFAVVFQSLGGLPTNVTVMATNDQGVAVGTVTNGGVYAYSASGICYWNYLNLALQADPNGNGTNGVPANCDNVSESVCPAAQCFSLVGRIE